MMVDDINTILAAFETNVQREFCPHASGLRAAFEQLVEDGIMVRFQKRTGYSGMTETYYKLVD